MSDPSSGLVPGFEDQGIDTFLTDQATSPTDSDVADYLSGGETDDGDVLFSSRMIGDFVADVTVEEEHTDDLTITEHPVETGAAITDHAYKNPARLVLRVGWSNSSSTATGPSYVRDVYQMLLDLQATRQPFSVSTGKRAYPSMLMQGLSITTDVATENSLHVTCALREIIIVNTTDPTTTASANQADPSRTDGLTNGGVRQAVPTVTIFDETLTVPK